VTEKRGLRRITRPGVLPNDKRGADPLARIEVFGPLYAEFERKASEGFFRRFAAEPRPLFFGDPESGFYPRFPLRRP
jgi:hypothetical protein